MALPLYSPEDVDVYLAGFIKISGFVDGTFISIAKDVGTFTTRESADGVVSRNHAKSSTYTVTITLASTSESNTVLTVASRLDDSTKMGMFPFIIKDRMGSTLLFSPKSWIETLPDTAFGLDVTDREWRIKCANAVLAVGGNDEASSLLEDAIMTSGGLLGNFL